MFSLIITGKTKGIDKPVESIKSLRLAFCYASRYDIIHLYSVHARKSWIIKNLFICKDTFAKLNGKKQAAEAPEPVKKEAVEQ